MMRGTTVLAVLALLVVTCQMKTLLVKTKSKGGDDYSTQFNSGSVGGSMNQGGGFGKSQSNHGSVGGNMNQRGGFGKSQSNHGSVGGNMNQDYNTQINTGSVGGGMHQGGGFGNNVQGNHGGVGGSMVQGGGFGNSQSNHGGVGGNMVQRGGSGNSQSNSGNVAGDMVQDYSAQMSCKILQKRLKLCDEGHDKPVSCDTFRKFYKKKNCENKANDYQFNFKITCGHVDCNSRDYQDTGFQSCCSDNSSG